MPQWTFERRLLAIAVAAWIVTAIVNLITDPYLGYDEAAFAAVARGDASAIWLYRSRGVTVLAEIGLAFGDASWQLRLPFVIACAAFPIAVYLLGRAAFDARTGAWAAAVLVTGHQLVARNGYILGDVPATACVVARLAVVVQELSRNDGPRWWLLCAAPAFAAAFYLRYGSAPIIAVALVLALLVWWRAVFARLRIVVATGALLVLLLVPHLLHSIESTGSMLGVLRLSADVPRRAYVGEGLVTYVTSNPLMYYGVLVTPCLVAAFAAVAIRLRRRVPIYLVAVASAQLLVIGLQSHAQPRYVFIAVTLLAVVGVGAIRTYTPRSFPRAMLAIIAAAWLAALIVIVYVNRSHAPTRGSVVAAADAIRRDAKEPCVVVATAVPQLLWYSGCEVERWHRGLAPPQPGMPGTSSRPASVVASISPGLATTGWCSRNAPRGPRRAACGPCARRAQRAAYASATRIATTHAIVAIGTIGSGRFASWTRAGGSSGSAAASKPANRVSGRPPTSRCT